MSDIPRATLMLGAVEFLSMADGNLLIYDNAPGRCQRLDEHQSEQLFVWLSNHLVSRREGRYKPPTDLIDHIPGDRVIFGPLQPEEPSE